MKKILLILASVFALAVPSFAQTALTQTTITGALTSSVTSIQVASATGINAPSSSGGASQTPGTATLLVIDNEAMVVRSVSGTLIGVQRGSNGTKARSHNANAVVWVGSPNLFLSSDPSGNCTPANTYSPTIVTTNAYQLQTHLWNCIGTTWQPLLTTGAITPAATSAAIGTSGQTFTVKGLVSGEPIYVASGPVPTSLCPLVGGAVTAANTVTLYFSTLTAAACTPAAGTYLIGVPRFSL
jgi:hypothetical protein